MGANPPKVHLFNPDNDLALAANVANYTPPKNPRILRHDGALLPLWWAGEDDMVLVEKIEDYDVLSRFCEKNYLSTKIVTSVPDYVRNECEGAPWGWSKYSREVLRRAGVANLPSDEEIERMRNLSHRRTSIILSDMLNAQFGITTPTEPFEVSSREEIRHLFSHHNNYVAKSPWSSSGRGVVDLSGMAMDVALKVATGVITSQGSVILERPLSKILDFAMLFKSRKNVGVEYVGLSVFSTDNNGAYLGNIVATEEQLESILTQYITKEYNDKIKQSLEICLSKLVSETYDGYLGVDMMIVNDGGKVTVAPTVELNLRMTMGVVAHHLAKRFGDGNLRKYFVGPKNMKNLGEKILPLIPENLTQRFAFCLVE